MKIARIAILIPILLLGMILSPNVIHPGHAATGEVCLADPTTAVGSSAPCPSSTPIFNGPTGQRIRIGVFIQSSDALNGFDVDLVANHTILKPVSTDLTGTVLPGTPTIILECIQGILIQGSVCSQADNVDTIHFAVTGGLGQITSSPTTGLLFTAIYTITNTTTTSGIPLQFQGGCSGSSVTGVCLTISNGSTSPDSETVQAATLDNSSPIPDVQLSSTIYSFGPEFPGTTNSATINATALNGYPVFAAPDSVLFTTAVPAGVTASLSGANPCSTGGAVCGVTLTLSASRIGNFSVTVLGTYATTDSLGNPDTLVSTVTILVDVYDFSFSVAPTSLTFSSNSTGSATATVSSLNGFSGQVQLSTGSLTNPSLTVSYDPSSIVLNGATRTSNITLSASPNADSIYHLIVKATSGTRSKNSATLTITVRVVHFTTTSLACSPATISAGNPSTCTATVTDVNASAVTPTGTISFTSSGSGNFSTNSCNLSGLSTNSAFCRTNFTPNGQGIGNQTISGLYGGDSSHSMSSSATSLKVIPPVPDFVITTVPTTVNIAAGTTGSSAITLSATGGFTGNVSLSVSPPVLSSIICNILPPSIFTSGSASLGCIDTVPEVSNVTVTGTSGNITHTAYVIFMFSPPGFSLSANPTTVTTTEGNNASSIISASSQSGFTGAVIFSVAYPSGIFCSITPLSIAVQGTTTLTCVSSQAAAFSVTVTGTSGTFHQSTTVQFNFLPPNPTGGIICIASPTATSCPVSPTVIPGPAPGGQFTVAVIADSSPTLNGFDITLSTNSSILKPTSVTPGTLLQNPVTTIFECIGGVNRIGSTSCPATDTAGTIQYAVTSALTSQPVTGVLFYAVYNVTANSANSPINFQTGCSLSSVPGGTCISISNGSTQLVPETAQTAKFSNMPYFDILPSTRSFVVFQGTSDTSQFLDVTSLNGFNGTVSLSASFSPAGPTVNISPPSLTVATGRDQFAILDVTVPKTTATGTYFLTIAGSNGTLPANSVTIILIVTGSDYAISIASNFVIVNAGSSNTTTITVSTGSGFTGTISLTATLSAPGTSIVISPTTITLGGSVSSSTATITIQAIFSSNRGVYPVTVQASSGPIVHSATFNVDIVSPSFTVSAYPTTITLNAGSNDTSTITGVSFDNFNGTVTLSTSVSPTGLTTSLSQHSFKLPPDGTIDSVLIIFTTTTTRPGIYSVTVTGTSGNLTEVTNVEVIVMAPPPPGFDITTQPSAILLQAGSSATSILTITSIQGFSGVVALNSSLYPATVNGSEPAVTFSPPQIILASGGFQTSTLILTTARTTPAIRFILTISGTSGNLTIHATVLVQVGPPPPLPPVAKFTFSPSNPIVGEQIQFDGSLSTDPMGGSIVLWTWSPGDGFGSFTSNSPFFYHNYNFPGNYTVTLTVQDNVGLTGTTQMTVFIRAQPAHDVAIVSVNIYPTAAVATQQVRIFTQIVNNGLSNETVTVTAYANGRAVQTVHNIFLRGCTISQFQNYCFNSYYVDLIWDTSGFTPGNYTISASVALPTGETDPTPSDNNFADGILELYPAPTITLAPNSGGTGTQVTIIGSGFAVQEPQGYVPTEILWVTFDDMFLGEAFNVHNGTFTFTFNVPVAQAGTHTIKALDIYSGARASTIFVVTISAGNLVVTINAGSVYFPGDAAVAYILTSLNGVPTGPNGVQLTVLLYFSNGTSRTMATTSLGNGLSEATYAIPKTGPLGTYAIVARAHMAGPLDASSSATFEVKLSWLNSNSKNIVGITTLAGVVGIAGVAWKKGYLRRKKETETSTVPF